MDSKTVFLVDIFNGGHREAFMQLFARSLLELGNRVVCIMPDTTSIHSWIDSNCSQYKNNARYYGLEYPKAILNTNGKWQRLKSYTALWRYYKKHIEQAAQQNNWPVDLVFFNCIDGHLANFLPHQLVDFVFPYQWAGLYFHPNHLRAYPGVFKHTSGLSDVDYALLAKNCLAVAIHDEGVVEKFSKRLNGKKVLLFPEIADITPPDPQNQVAKEIKEKAKGRTVLGMIGLEPHKGSYEFMKLAKAADPGKYFFAFCGIFSDDWYTFFENEAFAQEFRAFIDQLPENCYWNTGFITEGAEYNAVFSAFDIIFLFYRNFFSSSNRLTKAANLHRLVLSGDKYCVGEDVLQYNLGETANNSSVPVLLATLERLENRIRAKDFPYTNWKIYAQKHSEAVLKEKFSEILSLLE